MEVTFKEEQVNEILAYLATKPYKEVFQLINMIQQVAIENQKTKDMIM